jgi:hypothetical protein
MLRMRHRRADRTAADRRLRVNAISSIIAIAKWQGHTPVSVLEYRCPPDAPATKPALNC